VSEVLTPGQWKKAIKASGVCQRCPATEFLHAHHKDRDRDNNVIENGECLCRDCHAEEHAGERGSSLVAFDEASRRPETRRKIAEANRRPESRQQKSESQRRFFEEHPEATYSHWRGTKLSEEHKASIGAGVKASEKFRDAMASDETRRKKSEALLGRVFTDEWKANLRKAAQRREARKREAVAA
jgi:hypothetical protein